MTPNTARFALALALGTTLAFGAAAQSKKELASKLLQLQQNGVEQVGRNMAGQIAQRVLAVSGQALGRMPADKREATAREIQADVKKFYDELEPVLRKRATDLAPSVATSVYEERFSEDELKQVIAWLELPVSRKFAQVDAELGNALVQKIAADTKPTVDTRLAALEQTIAKKLGLKPGSAASAPASTAAPAAPKKP
jgi:flagellar biosynthesis/type III secretory pathway protein FliH